MQKTRAGVSVGLLGAALYLTALFGGYVPLILLAGYVLLAEENPWLKRAAVKAAVVVFTFALLRAVIGFVPDFLDLTGRIFRLFDQDFSVPILSGLVSLISEVLSLIEKIMLIVLGVKALAQGSLSVGIIDRTVGKHMD